MYYFTFFIFAIGGVLNAFGKLSKSSVWVLMICFSLWMIIHDGLRWGIATDWKPYYDYFENCLTRDGGFEWGYQQCNILIRTFTDNYSVFLVLHALLVYYSFYKFISKYSSYPLLSFLIFYYSMIGYLGMNRQYIALSFCILSIPFLLKRKYLLFGGMILLAAQFHISALLFSFTYFLNRHFSSSLLWCLLVISILISLSGIINKLPLEMFFLFGDHVGDRMEYYMLNSDGETSSLIRTILGIIKRTFWIVFLLFYRKRLNERFVYFDYMLNVLFFSVIFYTLFSGTMLQVIVARGLIYYNVFEIVLIPSLLYVIRLGYMKKNLCVLLILLGVYTMNKSMDVYIESVGDIYRPYNAVYMDPNYDATK